MHLGVLQNSAASPCDVLRGAGVEVLEAAAPLDPAGGGGAEPAHRGVVQNGPVTRGTDLGER